MWRESVAEREDAAACEVGEFGERVSVGGRVEEPVRATVQVKDRGGGVDFLHHFGVLLGFGNVESF